jgi:hypothetical protein
LLSSGVTTILATAGIGMTVREGLPRVSYATALDTYLNACVLYEMAAMIEYAAVNYFTKVLPVDGGVSSDEDEEEIVPLAPSDQSVRVYLYQVSKIHESVYKRRTDIFFTNFCLYLPIVESYVLKLENSIIALFYNINLFCFFTND